MYKKPSPDLGILMQLRASSGLLTDPAVFMLLNNSVAQSCYKIFFDPSGKPAGYMLWADVNEESAARLIRTGQYPVYQYEWDEGDIVMLLDVLVQPLFKYNILADLRAELRSFPQLVYRKGNRLVRRDRCKKSLQQVIIPEPVSQQVPKKQAA